MSAMTMEAPAAGPSTASPMFTCLSCSIGYPTPEDQREHYRSDLHRYNMKRRVAGLPPVRADVFNEKVLERRAAVASTEDAEGSGSNEGRCEACGKNFASANAYKDHLNSKKHKENLAKLESKKAKAGSSSSSSKAAPEAPSVAASADPPLVFRVPAAGSKEEAAPSALDSVAELGDSLPSASTSKMPALSSSIASAAKRGAVLTVEEGATEEEVQAVVDAKIASSRRVDAASECIFCSTKGFTSLDDSLEHMRKAHGFFVPERDYLIDLPGLMSYLSDKISVGNMCLYCNGRGRGFHSAEAARKHMIDKSHCKVGYDDEEDQLELSDFYDFTSSYPDAEWEDVSDEEGGEDGDEIVTDDDAASDDTAELPPRGTGNGIRYGEGGMELILPSGARLGHRSLARYWNQSLRPLDENSSGNTGRAIAHRLANDRNLIAQRMEKESDGTLVAQRGGHVVKARNRGEAREAKRHIREFRDVQRREHHKTIVGFKNNNQKYFRDPLLQ